MNPRIPKVDFRQFERLTREQLIDLILQCRRGTPGKVDRRWLRHQTKSSLRVLFLVTRLYCLLREQKVENRRGAVAPPLQDGRRVYRCQQVWN